MKTAKYIKGNITPYFLSYTEKQAQTVYDFKTMLPLFVGNLDDEPITLEEMKRYLNNNHPVVSTEDPSNKQPTVMFKLAINVDGETFPVVLADLQIMGRTNTPEQVKAWSVFSPNPKAIAVIRWKINDYKEEREERLERIELANETYREEARLDALLEQTELEQAQNRPKRKPVPLLWGEDFATAVSA
jgi:hypothetical protein